MSAIGHTGAGRYPILLLALLLSACAIGPDYERPRSDLPDDLGLAKSAQAAPRDWWKLFQDPALDALVAESLERNRDLRAAAERVEQARAQVTITRASLSPDAGIDASASRNRASQSTAFQQPGAPAETSSHRAVLRLSWEIDFWGKYRRATEAARADLAATEAGKEAIRSSIVGEVTRGYFALRSLDRRLEELARTVEGRRKALELQKLRLDAGVVGEFEYRQVESDLRVTEALLPALRQARTRQESALALLAGRSPRDVFTAAITRGTPTTPAVLEVPAGLPSDLLLRRPDLRQAEERLHAANARIGVARAAYFPSITLTGFFGGESEALSDLLKSPARTWNVAGGLLQPLFAGGQIRGGVEAAEARNREATVAYQQAIANAFREVRDAIAAQTNARDAVTAQRARADALGRTLELSRLRYDNGAVSLFEVLETERQAIAARLDAIDAERERAAAIVELYLALGA